MLTPLEVVARFVLVSPWEVVEVTVAPVVGWLLFHHRCHWSRCHSQRLLVVWMGVPLMVSVVDNVFHYGEGEVMVV